MKTLYKKVERWFYLQLELMLNMYKRRGNPMFTYEETHKPNEVKNIAKFDIKNKDIFQKQYVLDYLKVKPLMFVIKRKI